MKENRKTETCEMKVIARIHTDFPEKFGIPRQSGLVRELEGKIVFEPEYRNPQALKGLEEFSHIWILWEFSQSICTNWSPTVRPPRLGGQCEKRCICHTISLSPESDWTFQCMSGKNSYRRRIGTGSVCERSRFDGWNTDF